MFGLDANLFAFPCVKSNEINFLLTTAIVLRKGGKPAIIEEMSTDLERVFMNHAMGRLGCAAARFKDTGHGALAYGIGVDSLINALKAALSTKESLTNL